MNSQDIISGNKLQPILKGVLVKLEKVKDTTDSGIVLPETMNTRDQFADVIAVGKDVTIVKPGDRILMDHGEFKIIKHSSLTSSEQFAIIQENKISGIFTDNE